MEVTIEYKINWPAPFEGGELRATGRPVKGGKRIDQRGRGGTCMPAAPVGPVRGCSKRLVPVADHRESTAADRQHETLLRDQP